MKMLIVAGLVVASTVALSACGNHDDTANNSDTVPSTATTAYPPPATTAGMDNAQPPTARTSP
jgi:hypothetical protein